MFDSLRNSLDIHTLPAGRRPAVVALLAAALHVSLLTASAAANDIVLYSSDVTTISGAWKRAADGATAGGQKMVSSDAGWAVTGAPLASPTHYFQVNFTANANTAYRVWLRLKAAGNSVANDSVYVQFSDAVNGSGNAIWRIGTTSGMLVALERCSGCGVSGWGWRGGTWWTSETSIVRFPSAGTKTLRVQTREDGVAIDQIVLSPVTYYSKAPGASVNDNTIVSKTSTTTTTSTAWTSVKAVPGTIEAEDFDEGASGSTYWDSTSGNKGGAYRNTNVDIERSTENGYNIAYTARGEWLQYTVNVAKSATYTLQARVASLGTGGTFRVEFSGVNKTGSMTIPNTGGWQSWQTISKSFSLGAGQHRMRVVFETIGTSGATGNLNYIRLVESTTTNTTTTPPTGSKVRVMTWNIQRGRTLSNAFDPNGQVNVMVNSGADVILLQEVSTWSNDATQYTYRDLLQQKTGRTWYTAFGPSSTTTNCLGTLILSKYPLSSVVPKIFDGTGTVKAVATINGVPVTFANIHLSYYDTSKRTSQLYAFMDWIRQFNGPIIAGGDYNSWWGEWWIKHMETEAIDTWKQVTGNPDGGYTTGNVRFDYLFRSKYNASRMNPTAVWVISTDRSDHRPVVADYTVQ